MSIFRTQLKRLATGALVDAELHSALGLDELLEAEGQWAPERIAVLRRFLKGHVPDERWPQNYHWNWALKALRLRRLNIGDALSPVRLMGIKAEDRWQGMLMATSVGHASRLEPRGRELVYVDYVESAPWNIDFPDITQRPDLTGVGRQLMEAAVRLSRAMDFDGRIGLHSLEQAEGVYRHWGMTDLNLDMGYANLRYFEMSEIQANTFLREG